MSATPDRRSVLAGLAALPALAGTSLASTGQERPLNLRVIMSGHSLTDPIPGPLWTIVNATGGAAAKGLLIDSETVPGSPIEIRWNDEHGLVPDARHDIGNYDVLVMTERVPVRGAMEYHHTADYTLKWLELAWSDGNSGKGAATIFYASWISVRSGPGNDDGNDIPEERVIPFRQRLELEMTSWQEIADNVNSRRPRGCPRMLVIPGPKIMAAVYDEIQAGTAPGLARIEDLFRDDIHITDVGAFLIAVAHFAVIYGRDPRTIPPIRGQEGWPSTEQQEWMKDLVWTVVRNYSDSGLA